jgi:hypothetical protein
MRPAHLREATLKAAAAKGGNTMRTRLAAGEKNGRKRMAVLATVYDAEPAERTPADVIAPDPHIEHARRPGPKAAGKWLTGSVTDNAQTVISAAFDQAEQRDPGHERTWIVLLDGANAQIEQIKTEAAVRGVSIHLVCDFIHVLEYLWKAAWCFHESGDAAAEAFVARHANTILAHGPDQVIDELRGRGRGHPAPRHCRGHRQPTGPARREHPGRRPDGARILRVPREHRHAELPGDKPHHPPGARVGTRPARPARRFGQRPLLPRRLRTGTQ